MAFKFDGNGYISFDQWDTGTGDFSITGKFKTPASFSFQTLMGDTAGSNNILYVDAGGTLKLKISATATVTGLSADTEYEFSIARVGAIVTLTCNGQSPTIPYGGTSVPWDLFGAFGAAFGGKYTGSMLNVWTLTDDQGVERNYDFNQPIGTTNLPETTGGFNGTLTGFTTGGYDGFGANSIVVDALSSNQINFFNRDNLGNEKLLTITGENIGDLPTSIEYRLDYNDWVEVISSPTQFFSFNVSIKNSQFLQVRGTGTGTQTPPLEIHIGLSIVAAWQSNEQGYGLFTQDTNQGASSPQPFMFDGTDIVNLEDPVSTTGGTGGSTWPRIAKLYADIGTRICVYNRAVGGSLISAWQPDGANYAKIQGFVDKVGGLGLFTTIGGENDAQNGISQNDMEVALTNLVTAINTDFDCNSYICKFPMKAPVGGVATVFAAYDAVISANSFAKSGGDLSVIDIEIATADGNDGVHLKQNADLTTAANIRFAAQQAGMIESSTLNMVNTNTPDGTYSFDIYNESTKELIETKDVTFLSGNGSVSIAVQVGSSVLAKANGANPPVTGIAYVGVTE